MWAIGTLFVLSSYRIIIYWLIGEINSQRISRYPYYLLFYMLSENVCTEEGVHKISIFLISETVGEKLLLVKTNPQIVTRVVQRSGAIITKPQRNRPSISGESRRTLAYRSSVTTL
jgi:hypothetical protein